MVFWAAITFFVLLIPLALLIFGIIFSRSAFIGINSFFGYRTRLSRKSKETWQYAHKLIGKIWIILGSILFPVYAVIMIFIRTAGDSTVGLVGGLLTLASLVPIIISIIPVEKGLRKNFDIFGKRINPKD